MNKGQYGKLDDVLIEMNTYRKGAEPEFCQECQDSGYAPFYACVLDAKCGMVFIFIKAGKYCSYPRLIHFFNTISSQEDYY